VWKLSGQWTISLLYFPFWVISSKLLVPKTFSFLSVLGETFHFNGFWMWYRLACSISNHVRSSPVIELITSTTDSVLSVTISRPVDPRKGSFLCFFINHLFYHQSCLVHYFLFCTCLTVARKNYGRRSQLFT